MANSYLYQGLPANEEPPAEPPEARTMAAEPYEAPLTVSFNLTGNLKGRLTRFDTGGAYVG